VDARPRERRNQEDRPQPVTAAALRAAALFALLVVVSCGAGKSTPQDPPSAEEVRSFLANVAAAASGGDESSLHRFLDGGSSYPERELAMLRSAEFWKLGPASRVKRLGPDAFTIRLSPEEQPKTQGAVRLSMHIALPVRRGRDGQLRILSHREAERLAKLPVPEPPDGGAVVALDFPDEGGLGHEVGRHFATELWAEAHGDQVRLSIRFEPPLTGPRLRADLPITERLLFGEEIRVEIAIDADASEATGFRMDQFYRRFPDEGQRIQAWAGFGVDKQLSVDGKKFVQADGSRAWGLRAALQNVAWELNPSGSSTSRGEVVFEKTLADPEVKVEGDVLTLSVPAAVLPMKAGGGYRVMLERNGGHAPRLRPRQGRIGG